MRALLLGALAALLLGSLGGQAIVAAELPDIVPDPLPALPIGEHDPTSDVETLAPLAVETPELDGAVPAAPAPATAPRFGIPGIPPLDPPVVAAAATAGGVAIVLAGFALYSRLARSELLDHDRRDKLLALIRETPGIPLSEIAKRSDLAWGTTVYHLERLERAGFLVSERNAGRRCYFVATSVPRDARAGIGTLQQETTRSIATLVAERPGVTQTELCEELGLTASAASKQVSKLESAGLVRREREWKTVRLHPEPHLPSLLAPVTA